MEEVEVVHRRIVKNGRGPTMYGFGDASSRVAASRKPPLGKKSATGTGGGSRKIVLEREGILEVISCDDTEPVTVDGSSHSWSLSSNSIITTWLLEQDDDRDVPVEETDQILKTSSKSIQSFTSNSDQVFSPVYEVTGEPPNMFRENLKPLPKPGRTPKLGNFSYGGQQVQFGNLSYKSISDTELTSTSMDHERCRDSTRQTPIIQPTEKTPKFGNLSRTSKTPRLGNLSRISHEEELVDSAAWTSQMEPISSHTVRSDSRLHKYDYGNIKNEPPISAQQTHFGWSKGKTQVGYLQEPKLKHSRFSTETTSPTKVLGRFTDLTDHSSTSEALSPIKLRSQLSSISTSNSSTRAQAVLLSLDEDCPSSPARGISFIREIRLPNKPDPPPRQAQNDQHRRLHMRQLRAETDEKKVVRLQRELQLRLSELSRQTRAGRNVYSGKKREAPVEHEIDGSTLSKDDTLHSSLSGTESDWSDLSVNDENRLSCQEKGSAGISAKKIGDESSTQDSLWLQRAVDLSIYSTAVSAEQSLVDSSALVHETEIEGNGCPSLSSHGRTKTWHESELVRTGGVLNLPTKDAHLRSNAIRMKALVDEDDSSIDSCQEKAIEPEFSLDNMLDVSTSDLVGNLPGTSGMHGLKPPMGFAPKQSLGEKEISESKAKRPSATPVQSTDEVTERPNKGTFSGYLQRAWKLGVSGSMDAQTGMDDWSQELGVLREVNICDEALSLEKNAKQVDAQTRRPTGFSSECVKSNENLQSIGMLIENLNVHDSEQKSSDIEVSVSSETVKEAAVIDFKEDREHEKAVSKAGVCLVDERQYTKSSFDVDYDGALVKVSIGPTENVIKCEQENVFIKGGSAAQLQSIIKSTEQEKVLGKEENETSLSKPHNQKVNQSVDSVCAWPVSYRTVPHNFVLEKGFKALCKVTMDAVLTPRLCCAIDKSRSTSLHLSPILQDGPLHCTVILGDCNKTTDEGESQLVVRKPLDESSSSFRFRSSLGLTATLPDLSTTVQRSCNKINRDAFRVLLGSWRHKKHSTTPTSGGIKPALQVEHSPEIRKRADGRKRSLSSDFMNDLVQDTELRELISNANALFRDVLGSQSNPITPSRASNLCNVDEDDDMMILDPKDLTLLTDEGFMGFSDNTTDSSVLEDKELRAVMKLTNDAEDLSALFPTFSYDSQCSCESDDGLDREIGDLIESEACLRKELELATSMDQTANSQAGIVVENASSDSTPAFSDDSFMAVIGGVNQCDLSTDSSLVDFQGVEHSSVSSFAVTMQTLEDTDELARKVRFNDDIQEHIFEMPSGDDPSWMSSGGKRCGDEETFLGEVFSLFEDIMDELASFCVTTSNALDRGRMLRPTAGNGSCPRRSLAG